jgi:acetyl-CoA synthetase
VNKYELCMRSYKHQMFSDYNQYKKFYLDSISSENFWKKKALEELSWESEFDQVLSSDKGWFAGGRLNASYNCLDVHLDLYGNKLALICENEVGDFKTYTYEQLTKAVKHCAAYFYSLGIRQGDVITFYLPMIAELYISLLACSRIGAVHNVVFAGFGHEALSDRIIDSKSKIVVTTNACIRKNKIINLKATVDKAIDSNSQLLCKVICINNLDSKFAYKKQRDLLWSEHINKTYPCAPIAAVDANHPLFMLYTSGSTGKPKGIIHSTAGYLLGVKLSSKIVFDFCDTDIFWSTADMGWITGHSYGLYAPFLNHTTVFLYDGALNGPNWERSWDNIERHKITKFYTAPTALRSFIQDDPQAPQKYDLSSLKLLGSVGEILDESSWQWYFSAVGKESCPIVNTWWQTETGSIMLSQIPGISVLSPGSVGTALPGVDAQIDQGSLTITKPWPSMFLGVNNDMKRYEQYWKQGCEFTYLSGDRAIYRQESGYHLLGRCDDVLNISGHRISSGEIEAILSAHEFVIEVAVVGREHRIKGQVALAFVIIKKDQGDKSTTKDKLKQYVKTKAGSFMIPEEIFFLDSLPKTRSGKIMRRLLKDIACGCKSFGDTSTIENPAVLDEIIASIRA